MHEEINEFVGVVKANMKTLFKNQDEMKVDIEKLQNNQVDLKELVVVVKEQQRQHQLDYEESKKERAEHSKILSAMHDSLLNINTSLQDQGKQIGDLSGRVGDLEENGKIDVRKLWETMLYTVLPSILGSLLLAGIIYWFGIK